MRADRGDTHFKLPVLNRWFALSSLLLLVSVAWMVIDDWDAEWKGYQRDFRSLELGKARASLAELDASGAIANRTTLEAQVSEAQGRLDEKRAELAAYEDELFKLNEDRYVSDQNSKGVKGEFNMARYRLEEARNAGMETTDPAGYATMESVLTAMSADIEGKDKIVSDQTDAIVLKEAQIDGLRSEVAAADKALSSGTRELTRIETKIQSIDPDDFAVQAAELIRDFPGIDFIGPNMLVRKHVLADLTFELNFTKKTRIDMCETCHLGMENPDFTEDAQPFTSHPRLDLYLTSKSPHPANKIGCTICHRGSGESLSFIHTDHRPNDDHQEEAWQDEHHWHKQHHWDYPMLPEKYIEASCIQCHKDSMELIAEDVPEVTKGYRMFERYGCYACHKVDWFPTKRRPGPSLTNLAAKVNPEFVDAWIAQPRSFRPTTWMPQIFHLENYAADEAVVERPNWGTEDQPILGQAWNDTAVASITAYLFANHPEQVQPEAPVQGNAERGREVFTLSGCLACHNLAPYEGEDPGYSTIGFEVGRYNEHGPNLRGVASKINARWLYNWIKDPQAYWPETSMPNLRLSDQDAADITAYMMDDPDGIFTDTPDGWQQGGSPIDMAALKEQARWFYAKEGRNEIAARLAGTSSEADWRNVETLKVAVGEAFVRNQGCFSCHDITGMEKDMPIGTELSNWASKTVDKLDFGLSYRQSLTAKVGGKEYDLPKIDHHYHDGWLRRKLDHPRSFDLEKVKNPKEKLRMPWFDFDASEIDALATFVSGLVIDEVQRARMIPTPEKASMDQGLRVIRQKNCVACHVLDPGEITYHDNENGRGLLTIKGEVLPMNQAEYPVQPSMDGRLDLIASMQEYANYMEEPLGEEVIVRLLNTHADVGTPGDRAFVPLQDLISSKAPFGGDFVNLVNQYYYFGLDIPNPDYDAADPDSEPTIPWTIGYDEENKVGLIEDRDGKQRSYETEGLDKIRWAFAPPVLINEGHKLQREWFYAFLKDPVTLREQMRVRMPSFNFGEGEAEAVADYFANRSNLDWHSRYAHTVRQVLGQAPRSVMANPAKHQWDADAAPKTWPLSKATTEGGPGLTIAQLAESTGLKETILIDIEAGHEMATKANFSKLHAWAAGEGFLMVGPVPTSYEVIQRRQPSYAPNVPLGHNIGKTGVECFKCHFHGGEFPTQVDVPLSWAPDLMHTSARLREDYVYEWLWGPSLVYPGTSMADNFISDVPQYQTQAPGSTNASQIHAVLDWLYNFEETPGAD